MHEMGIAQEVCRIAREQVGAEGCAGVVEVGLEVGDQAGVEPDNLLFWLDILLGEPPFSGARPAIRLVGGDVLRVSYLEVRDGDSPD
jgi:Zn finger protein HypA/HybF involved in hydrogenase expression